VGSMWDDGSPASAHRDSVTRGAASERLCAPSVQHADPECLRPCLAAIVCLDDGDSAPVPQGDRLACDRGHARFARSRHGHVILSPCSSGKEGSCSRFEGHHPERAGRRPRGRRPPDRGRQATPRTKTNTVSRPWRSTPPRVPVSAYCFRSALFCAAEPRQPRNSSQKALRGTRRRSSVAPCFRFAQFVPRPVPHPSWPGRFGLPSNLHQRRRGHTKTLRASTGHS